MHFLGVFSGRRLTLAAALAGVAITAASQAAYANVAITQVSLDPFTNTNAQHRTEVEPDTFVQGSTIVATFQAGGLAGAASSAIGLATRTNSARPWATAFLSALRVNQVGAANRQAVTPP